MAGNSESYKAPRGLDDTVFFWEVQVRIEDGDFDNPSDLAYWREYGYTHNMHVMLTVGSSEQDAKERIKSRIKEGKAMKPHRSLTQKPCIYQGPIHEMNFTYKTAIAEIAPYKKAAISAVDRAQIIKIGGTVSSYLFLIVSFPRHVLSQIIYV